MLITIVTDVIDVNVNYYCIVTIMYNCFRFMSTSENAFYSVFST